MRSGRALIVDTWHHISARVQHAQKLKAALRPNARIYIVDFTLEATHGPPQQHRIAARTVVEELAGAGLHAEVLLLELPEQYVVQANVAQSQPRD